MRLTRNLVRTTIAWGAASVLTLALVWHYASLGGPYFTFPETVQDHVWPEPFPSRDVIVLARRAAKVLPRDVTVTAIQPSTALAAVALIASGSPRRAAFPIAVALLTTAAAVFFYIHTPDPSWWIASSSPRVLLTPLCCLLIAAAAARPSPPREADAVC